MSRDRRFSSIARLRSVVILLGVGSEMSLRAALGGIEIDAFAGCRVSLSASVVSGAMTYRWYAEQNGCWGYERVQLAITTQPTLQLDGPLPFDSCWFRVDAETSGGNVVESQYSTSSPPSGSPPWGGGGQESPVRAGPAAFTILGHERVWVDAGPQAIATARFWIRGLQPDGCAIQWLRDSVPIPGANAPVLEFPVTLADDGARISARVTTPCGHDTLGADRLLSVTTRPAALGFRWDFVSQTRDQTFSSWCCTPSMFNLRRRQQWSSASGSGVTGVVIGPNGAQVTNREVGQQGGSVGNVRVGFTLQQWMRISLTTTAEYAVTCSAISSSLEGAAVSLPSCPPPSIPVSTAAVLAPGSYVLSNTCRAGAECCGGNICQTWIFTSVGCSITFSLVPLCSVEPGHPACCLGNLDGAGQVDGGDLGVLLGAWGRCSAPCVADLNGDLAVDGADLGVLLNAWGACAP